MKDDLRPEYDLKKLRVRKFGTARKSFGDCVVRLEPDVAAVFSSAEAVNEALRLAITVMRERQANDSPL